MRAKVAWCSLPLVWWPGGSHTATFTAIGLPSGLETVRRALSGLPEGLYALKMGLPQPMPSATQVRTWSNHLGARVLRWQRIGRGEVRAAIDALIRASRVREQLGFDVDAWRRDVGRHVSWVERALRDPSVRQALCVLAPQADCGPRKDLVRLLDWRVGTVARLPADPGRMHWLRGRPALLEHGDLAVDEWSLFRPTQAPWAVLEAVSGLAAQGIRGPDVARLVGHLMALGVTDVSGLVSWFRYAQEPMLALEVLEACLARGGRRASDVRALVETLALSGDTILRQRGGQPFELTSRSRGGPSHVLGRLGDVSDFERLAIVESGRYGAAERVAHNQPAALGAYARELIDDRVRESGTSKWRSHAYAALAPETADRLCAALSTRRRKVDRGRALGAFLGALDLGWSPTAAGDAQVRRLLDAGVVAFLVQGDPADHVRRIKRVTLALEALDADLDWERLLRAVATWDGNANLEAWQCRTAIWLAGDLPRRLGPLLSAIPANTDKAHHPLKGLLELQSRPRIRYALQKACGRPEDIPRVVALLSRVTIAARYPALRDVMDAVETVLGWGGSAGEQLDRLVDSVPKSVALARRGVLRLQREAAALEANGRAPERLAYLRERLADPRLAETFRLQEERQVEKHLRIARLALIERAVDRVLLEHWQGRPRLGEDWDNAEKLLRSTRQNRRLLRRMLRAQAHGVDLRRAHPGNRPVLARLAEAGVDIDVWLSDWSWTERRTGWTVRTARDGLEVLQMGNRFATCLALGGCNAFSTIANAVEANKRVLYVEDASGKLRGRRLVGLAGARLVAFDAHGVANHGHWVRIVLDLACRELARACGAELGGSGLDSYGEESDLEVFADWYNDGLEEIDWWVSECADADAVRRELDDEARWKTRWPCLRAVLWLGEPVDGFRHLKPEEHNVLLNQDKRRR